MQETVKGTAHSSIAVLPWLASRLRVEAPSLTDIAVAIVSAVLLVLSFPDFSLWPLAWLALVPVMLVVVRRPLLIRSFLLGWITGTVFFYCSCYWLTFSIINYGGINPVLAYLLLIPGAIALGLFHALFFLVVAAAINLFRQQGLLLAPFIWPGLEWSRLALTGQLWNALGYSQAYRPVLIQSASWAGVYGVGFLIVMVNCAIAFGVATRSKRGLSISATVLALVAITVLASRAASVSRVMTGPFRESTIQILALQPNVPMTLVKSAEELRELRKRHLVLSEQLLQSSPDNPPRLLVWPESPMTFEYARDPDFQTLVTNFAREHRTALLFNSQEPAPADALYNAAMLIDREGKLVGQYDKIRLLPFGEYVPLPRWLPGANLITAIVGDFTPGANYTIFRVGELKLGVFICVESAYPSIARAFAQQEADALINISNDGYLGRTAVMKQHLANAVFRAVENGRPIARVTNSGITALIEPNGRIRDETNGFEEATRHWTLSRSGSRRTFYTKHGDVFVLVSSALTVLIFGTALWRRSRTLRK